MAGKQLLIARKRRPSAVFGPLSFSRGPPQVCFQLPALPRTGHIRGRHFFSPGQVFSAIEAGRVGLGNRQGLRSQHHLVPYNGRKPVMGTEARDAADFPRRRRLAPANRRTPPGLSVCQVRNFYKSDGEICSRQVLICCSPGSETPRNMSPGDTFFLPALPTSTHALFRGPFRRSR